MLDNLYAVLEEAKDSIKEMKDADGSVYDTAEIFSPARTSRRANERGLRGGFSLDLNFVDKVTGRKWDLSNPADQEKCKRLIARTKPRVLTVSPPCTLFSLLQNLSGGVKDMEAMKKAIEMINFGVEMCLLQLKANRHFVFEHPASATSWKLTSLAALSRKTALAED
jgi:site-specific DNA-cytosine methylase